MSAKLTVTGAAVVAGVFWYGFVRFFGASHEAGLFMLVLTGASVVLILAALGVHREPTDA